MAKVWVARSRIGELFLFYRKIDKHDPKTWDTDNPAIMYAPCNNDPIGEGITFENSPVEVELVRAGTPLAEYQSQIIELAEVVTWKNRQIELMAETILEHGPEYPSRGDDTTYEEDIIKHFEERAKDETA